MNIVWIALAVAWAVGAVVAWLSWQLLRQNGRILLRLDDMEARLHELEFGEPDSQPNSAATMPDRANRFANRSLVRSKINRDGVKAGTSAPSFRLPRLDGDELSLEELRGKRVLLVFCDPRCGPCNALAPELEKFHRESADISVVMISRGEPRENRAKVKEHGLTFPVLLQQRWEISRLYAMFATPMGYIIDEQGIIANDVAVGVGPILALMAEAKKPVQHEATGALVLDRNA
jgi:peroxiredoxin